MVTEVEHWQLEFKYSNKQYKMVLTSQIFASGKSSNNGYNKEQLAALGINDLTKGWAQRIIGSDIPEESIKKFLDLKDYHFKRKIENGGTLKRKVAAKMGVISFAPVAGNITVKEQYTHPNWQKLRLLILERDKYSCINCRETSKTLHVHHLKYKQGARIWEVPLWYLVTLCEDCHSEEHGRDLTIKN